MPRGASPKREREYKKLERKVAARIVNKQRKMYGETKDEKEKDARGQSPDRNLPLPDFQKLTIRQVERQMESLSAAQLRKIRAYELKHKHRKGLLTSIDRKLSAH